jgi:hypothetical protein
MMQKGPHPICVKTTDRIGSEACRWQRSFEKQSTPTVQPWIDPMAWQELSWPHQWQKCDAKAQSLQVLCEKQLVSFLSSGWGGLGAGGPLQDDPDRHPWTLPIT